MKTADLAFAIVGGLFAVALLIMAAAAYVHRRAGINVQRYKAAVAKGYRGDQFANEIEDSILDLSDMDHVLAAKLRPLVRKYREDTRKL